MKLGFDFTERHDTNSQHPDITYQMHCNKYGKELIAGDVLDRIKTCPDIITESFLLSAAVDEAINLDGSYILLRREPAALLRLLQRNNKIGTTSTAMSPSNINKQSFERNRRKQEMESDRSSSKHRKKRNNNANDRNSSWWWQDLNMQSVFNNPCAPRLENSTEFSFRFMSRDFLRRPRIRK